MLTIFLQFKAAVIILTYTYTYTEYVVLLYSLQDSEYFISNNTSNLKVEKYHK